MSITTLKILADQREELFKAEIAGLLHNLGKLHGEFLSKFSGGSSYNDQRTDDASQVVCFKAAQGLIRDAEDCRQLIGNLLSDAALWGSNADIATQLSAEWKKISRTSEQFNEIRKDLKKAAQAFSSQTTNMIIEWLLGACKLADLVQISGIDKYLSLNVKQWLRGIRLKILTEEHTLSEILLLYWDAFHSQPQIPNEQMRLSRVEMWINHTTILPRYLATAHGVVSGVEKPTLKDKKNPSDWSQLKQSSVFGFEVDKVNGAILDAARNKLLGLLVSCNPSSDQWRRDVAKSADEHLSLALAETQWPVNDVSLWEYASSIAALFKSAVAKAIIENRFVATSELKWRLLCIRYDGLTYLSRALHISDLLARRKALDAALDAVKAVIEVEYPLGNEIYRDENGSVLIVPHVETDNLDLDLLALLCGEEGALRNVLARKFSQAVYDQDRPTLYGDVSPVIALSRDKLLGKEIQLPKTDGWNNPPLQPDPANVAEWWSDESKHADICTVCGLRPQGYGAPNDNQKLKAQDRSICWVCMERRDERSKNWAQLATSIFQTSIWVDEVADNNGRVALVVGQFVLDGWLDGSLIPTMQKSASFARIQRCWRTTETFWKEIEYELHETIGRSFARA